MLRTWSPISLGWEGRGSLAQGPPRASTAPRLQKGDEMTLPEVVPAQPEALPSEPFRAPDCLLPTGVQREPQCVGLTVGQASEDGPRSRVAAPREAASWHMLGCRG